MRLLKHFYGWILAHKDALQQSFSFLKTQWIGTIFTLLLIAVTLSLPMLFSLFGKSLHQWMIEQQKEAHLSLFLSVGLPSDSIDMIFKGLQQDPNVANVHLISAKEGYLALQQQEGFETIASDLSDNPLPAVIEVTPVYPLPAGMDYHGLVSTFSNISGVESVQFDGDWVRRFSWTFRIIRGLMEFFMILLGLAVILMIGNTLRLILSDRQDEIQVLKLIGATDGMIIRPYLYMGVLYAGMGALIALGMTHLLIYELLSVIPGWIRDSFFFNELKGCSMSLDLEWFVLSIALGWLGAYVAVKRQIAQIDL